MHRLILALAGRTYHIVGNLKSLLKILYSEFFTIRNLVKMIKSSCIIRYCYVNRLLYNVIVEVFIESR